MAGNSPKLVAKKMLDSSSEENKASFLFGREKTILGLCQSHESTKQQKMIQEIKKNGLQLIPNLGHDMSLECILRCSRSYYRNISMLNTNFRELIRSGSIYRQRRHEGIVENWIYYSCDLLEWKCFDPNGRKWMDLPRMISDECFKYSNKESLAVGTEVLVFGREVFSQVIYQYSLLTNKWSTGMTLNTPRSLFATASQGEIAIVVGGCNLNGTMLNSAELYNVDTGMWEIIQCMTKARKMCAGVFMDDKFYVLGGIGPGNPKVITSGEEYDLETKTWREIPNMFPEHDGSVEIQRSSEAPPLVAVVNNQLYYADYVLNVVKKYDKERNSWKTLGSMPEHVVSINGWGVAFRACGDRLILIGGPRSLGGGLVEINSWVPNDDYPRWELLGSRFSNGNFVYNCSVMGC